MREPSWSLNMLAEVLSAFSVDEPNAMVNVVFRVAESVDAEVAAIIRSGRVEQSVGLLARDTAAILEAAPSRADHIELPSGAFHAHWAPLGKGDFFMVGRISDRFDLEERSLLRAMGRSIELSSQVFMAMEAERLATRLREELALADSIQKRMLCDATELNAITPELDVAATILTSKEVGGDLYDWIPLDAHRYCFCIGDVAGKGVPAALVMSTCLSLLRAYVEVYDSPSAIMRRINQRLCHHNENCTFTTMLIGVINSQSGELRYCNAGHNPPMIRRAHGKVETLSKVHGPAAGIMDGITYGEDKVVMAIGDSLVSYTDGANETFNRQKSRYGTTRLRDFVRANQISDAQIFVERLCQELQAFASGEQRHDDTTLLVFRFSGCADVSIASRDNSLSLHIANDVSSIAALQPEIRQYCNLYNISKSTLRKVLVVVDDILNNTINYGCRDMGSLAEIRFQLRLHGGKLVLTISDNGLPFNPLEMASPNISAALEERKVGGLGIHLMRSLTTAARYRREQGVNTLVLEFTA
jgi:serine phosphatase RsbU (regulator of sigma subunit)/anti-sigma regulatory factor (Ser/Thr protein kinase)